MSKQAVQFNVRLSVNDGKLDVFEGVVQRMIAGTLKEPGALGYEFYFSEDRNHCHLIENYKDADAVLAHMEGPVVGELVPKLLGVSSLNGFAVYGDPGPKAAASLAGIGAEIFRFWQGLDR